MIKNVFNSLKKSDIFIIASGLIVFLAITLATITKSSVWFDEAFGAYLIRFDFWDIARYTAADVHPPLYYWLLKGWSLLFGNSELALRSMSVLFGCVSIAIGYLLVKRLFSRKAAAISMFFMVLSPMFIRYSQEMRMYTVVTAIALTATYALSVAMKSKKKLPWVIYGILVGLGMLTHYFIAIIWIAHWIWRADCIIRSQKKKDFLKLFFSKKWIFTHLLAILVFGAWLPFFVIQVATVQAYGFWIPPVTPNTLINYATNAVLYQDSVNVSGWLSALFFVFIALLIYLSINVYKKLNTEKQQSYRVVIFMALMPMLVLFLASMPPLRSVFIDRYLITSALMVAILIGITISFSFEKYQKKTILFTMFAIGLMSFGVVNVWQIGNYNKESKASNNTRQIIEAAVSKTSLNQPIIAATPWLYYEASFYSTNKNPIYYIEPSDYPYGSLLMLKENDDNKIKDLDQFSNDNPVVWYVGYSKEGKLDPPSSDWQKIQEVTVNDSVSGNPAYIAVQYKTSK